jgi:hypothetical protein
VIGSVMFESERYNRGLTVEATGFKLRQRAQLVLRPHVTQMRSSDFGQRPWRLRDP